MSCFLFFFYYNLAAFIVFKTFDLTLTNNTISSPLHSKQSLVLNLADIYFHYKHEYLITIPNANPHMLSIVEFHLCLLSQISGMVLNIKIIPFHCSWCLPWVMAMVTLTPWINLPTPFKRSFLLGLKCYKHCDKVQLTCHS